MVKDRGEYHTSDEVLDKAVPLWEPSSDLSANLDLGAGQEVLGMWVKLGGGHHGCMSSEIVYKALANGALPDADALEAASEEVFRWRPSTRTWTPLTGLAWDGAEKYIERVLELPLTDHHLRKLLEAAEASSKELGASVVPKVLAHSSAGHLVRTSSVFLHPEVAIKGRVEELAARLRIAKKVDIRGVGWLLGALIGASDEVLETFEALALDRLRMSRDEKIMRECLAAAERM